MTQIVLWSGGMDSTLLLYNRANAYENDMINALTVVTQAGSDKQRVLEKKARRVLLKVLPKNIRHHEVKVDSTIRHQTWQMPIWLSYLIPHVADEDIVSLAYLASDGYSFWNPRQKMLDAFNAHMRLMGNDKAVLEFPLEGVTKGYVIQSLKKAKLLSKCWYCGEPKKGKPCGKCMKCMSYKRWKKFPETGNLV